MVDDDDSDDSSDDDNDDDNDDNDDEAMMMMGRMRQCDGDGVREWTDLKMKTSLR